MRLRKFIKNYIIPVSLLAAGIIAFKIGHWAATSTGKRNPAALHPNTYDLSSLDGQNLRAAIKDRLVLGTKIITAENEVGVELNQFMTKNTRGDAVTACNHFTDVEIIFEAGDMAVSGELPRMIVTGPCISDDDLGVISPLMIQMNEIIPSQVMERKFASTTDEKASVRFENVSDTWPRVWVLRQIRLSNSSEDVSANIDDFRRLLGKTVSFEWDNSQ